MRAPDRPDRPGGRRSARSRTQVDDVLSARSRCAWRMGDRVLVTTLTKRMAENLTEYLDEHGVRVRYLHSDIDTVERVEIIRDLRLGKFDVLVGINLLREGLDMPEVSLVAILDADKEGFLRSAGSLIQTIGRAARNLRGKAILYADRDDRLDAAGDRAKPTGAADKQVEYNTEHGDHAARYQERSRRHPRRRVLGRPARVAAQDRRADSGLLVADAGSGHPAHQEARAGDVQARAESGVRASGAVADKCTSCAMQRSGCRTKSRVDCPHENNRSGRDRRPGSFRSIAGRKQRAAVSGVPAGDADCRAANGTAFAWLIRQGGRTQVRYARAPKFEAQTLLSVEDGDGQPPTDVVVSPDGQFVAYTTGNAFGGEQPYNPTNLIAPAGPSVWVTATAAGATARRIGPGFNPVFAPDGARLLYRHDKDLLIANVSESAAPASITVPGGAKFADIQWSPDGSTIAFVQDRGGYAFLGLYRPGGDRVQWLVTGPDRATSPMWSPDGRQLAYLEFPGREHTRKYDNTESEPFAVKVVDAHSGVSKMLWQTSSHASASLEDPDSALRWVGNDRVVFYSEHDGWGRLMRSPPQAVIL